MWLRLMDAAMLAADVLIIHAGASAMIAAIIREDFSRAWAEVRWAGLGAALTQIAAAFV